MADGAKTTDEPPEPSADFDTLCTQAWIGAASLEGFARNAGTPREVAYACRGAAKLLEALRREARKAREEARAR